MYRVLSALAGAVFLTVTSFAIPTVVSEANAYCAGCNKARPDSVQTNYRTQSHTRYVNRYRVVPRTRVVDDNRLLLHRTIVNNRYNTVVRNHVRYEDTVVHRVNTAHRYATENRNSYATRQENTSSHTTRVRYVQGTNCNCGGRYSYNAGSRGNGGNRWGSSRRESGWQQQQED
jgi:hypothetical protein